MAIPYAFEKVLKREEPSLKIHGKSPKDRMNWLMQSGNMTGKYLGACLDACRWGSPTTVMWEADIRGLMKFIDNWREQNQDNEKLYHEVKLKKYWKKFELPHIHYKKCPGDVEHKGNFIDRTGIVRCAHVSRYKKKEGFIYSSAGFDKLSKATRIRFFESKPSDPSYEDDDGNIERSEPEYSQFLFDMEMYEKAGLEEIIDPCYAIISDKDTILPFEAVLKRLNLAKESITFYCDGARGLGKCKRLDELSSRKRQDAEIFDTCYGHLELVNEVIFPFDGWTLAHYMQKWKQQVSNGKAPWFTDKREECILNPNDYAFYD